MKIASFIITASLFSLTACGSQNQETQTNDEFEFIQTSNPGYITGKKTHSITDPNTGMVAYQMDLPASWQMNQAQGIITGPNGLEMRQYQYVSNVYTNDPYMSQIYAQSGQRMAQPIGAEGVLRQDLNQRAPQLGLNYVKSYPLPSLAQKDRAYADQLYTLGNPQKHFEVLASEWKSNDGKNVMILIHYSQQVSMGLTIWGYSLKALTATPADFEAAKRDYIAALEGIRRNPSAIQAYNQREHRKLQQNDAAFQRNQQIRNQNFQATQRAHREASDAAFNAQRSIYETQSASFDRMNQQNSNMILEENTMYNPTNGETYQVESGYNNYWMNSDGEYIGTDDYNYNPNQDQYMNNTDWQ